MPITLKQLLAECRASLDPKRCELLAITLRRFGNYRQGFDACHKVDPELDLSDFDELMAQADKAASH